MLAPLKEKLVMTRVVKCEVTLETDASLNYLGIVLSQGENEEYEQL